VEVVIKQFATSTSFESLFPSQSHRGEPRQVRTLGLLLYRERPQIKTGIRTSQAAVVSEVNAQKKNEVFVFHLLGSFFLGFTPEFVFHTHTTLK
jgi:hypothetical protein